MLTEVSCQKLMKKGKNGNFRILIFPGFIEKNNIYLVYGPI